MGSAVVKGITASLLVTVLTLLAGIVWSSMGFGGLSISQLIDVGLIASCLAGGYRTAKESGTWFMGGVAGAGFVVIGTLLLALFLPIRGLGFLQVLGEGALIGLAAGAFGAGKKSYPALSSRGSQKSRIYHSPAYTGYGQDGDGNTDFEWDREDDREPGTAFVQSSWLEGSEDNYRSVCEIEEREGEEERIEWPWDREKENKVTLQSSLPLSQELVIRDKDETKAKPWWEQ